MTKDTTAKPYKTFIESRIQFEALHNWKGAPESICYLRMPHRHIFTIIATKEVTHTNRDIEFITFGKKIRKWLDKQFAEICGVKNMGQMSCEMLAEKILVQFDLQECKVYEDMENAGFVRRV